MKVTSDGKFAYNYSGAIATRYFEYFDGYVIYNNVHNIFKLFLCKILKKASYVL